MLPQLDHEEMSPWPDCPESSQVAGPSPGPAAARSPCSQPEATMGSTPSLLTGGGLSILAEGNNMQKKDLLQTPLGTNTEVRCFGPVPESH